MRAAHFFSIFLNAALLHLLVLPLSTFQQRMQLIQHNKDYFPVATESVDKENVIINTYDEVCFT